MEFTICQDKTNKAPLVLSEFLGSASSFSSALLINPHDIDGVADAINQGLVMPDEEKFRRHADLYQSVTGYTSHTWAASIVKQLLENVGGDHQANQTPYLEQSALKSKYDSAKKRLLLFDYDVSQLFSPFHTREMAFPDPVFPYTSREPSRRSSATRPTRSPPRSRLRRSPSSLRTPRTSCT